jgi:hypothetical protein
VPRNRTQKPKEEQGLVDRVDAALAPHEGEAEIYEQTLEWLVALMGSRYADALDNKATVSSSANLDELTRGRLQEWEVKRGLAVVDVMAAAHLEGTSVADAVKKDRRPWKSLPASHLEDAGFPLAIAKYLKEKRLDIAGLAVAAFRLRERGVKVTVAALAAEKKISAPTLRKLYPDYKKVLRSSKVIPATASKIA